MESTILAQCVNVGVTYLSDMEKLAESYEYQEGDYLMISIQKDMDIDAVYTQVKEVFGVEDLSEVDRQGGSSCVRIILTEVTK